MKWWFKKDKEVASQSENNNFNSTEAPATNSNFYEFLKQYYATNESNLTKTGNNIKFNNTGMLNDIDGFINERTLSPWFLLQLQANYYINTIKYEIDDPILDEKIRQVIWGAFIYGRAGLYFNSINSQWRVVLINNLDYENRKLKVAYLTDLVIFNAEIDLKIDNYQYIIKNKDLDNLFIFNWGVTSQSALVYQMPFIKTQGMVFTQLILSSLLLGKKVAEKVDAPNKSYEEIKTWLDPRKFFIRLKFDSKTNDKIEIIEKDIDQNLKEIEFYKEFQNYWYSLFGRRVNSDFKKERQITDELEMVDNNFSALELEWLNQFKIFVEKINKSGKGVNIKYGTSIDRGDDREDIIDD